MTVQACIIFRACNVSRALFSSLSKRAPVRARVHSVLPRFPLLQDLCCNRERTCERGRPRPTPFGLAAFRARGAGGGDGCDWFPPFPVARHHGYILIHGHFFFIACHCICDFSRGHLAQPRVMVVSFSSMASSLVESLYSLFSLPLTAFFAFLVVGTGCWMKRPYKAF